MLAKSHGCYLPLAATLASDWHQSGNDPKATFAVLNLLTAPDECATVLPELR